MKIASALQAVFDSFRSIEGSPNHPNFQPEDFGRAMREMFPYLPGMAYGAIEGTGAAIRVGVLEGDGIDEVNAELQFKPSVVAVVNVTDPGLFVHIRGMTAAHALAITDTAALVNANGITLHDDGFTLGTNADLNTDGESLFYVAFGK